MSEGQNPSRYKPGDILPNGAAFDPALHRVLKNGTIQDKATTKFLTAPAPEHAPIHAGNAQELARRRWERSREEFAAGMAEGAGDLDGVPVQAWRLIGKKSVELLKDAKSPRGFADLARFAGEAGGFIPLPRGRDETSEGAGVSQPMIMVLIAQLVDAFGGGGGVVDGSVKDD